MHSPHPSRPSPTLCLCVPWFAPETPGPFVVLLASHECLDDTVGCPPCHGHVGSGTLPNKSAGGRTAASPVGGAYLFEPFWPHHRFSFVFLMNIIEHIYWCTQAKPAGGQPPLKQAWWGVGPLYSQSTVRGGVRLRERIPRRRVPAACRWSANAGVVDPP